MVGDNVPNLCTYDRYLTVNVFFFIVAYVKAKGNVLHAFYYSLLKLKCRKK